MQFKYTFKLFQISIDKFMPTENGEKSDEEDFVEEVVERPHEVEVEEVREKEVMQDFVETRKIAQVRAMYLYRGQGMMVEKGEVGENVLFVLSQWYYDEGIFIEGELIHLLKRQPYQTFFLPWQ